MAGSGTGDTGGERPSPFERFMDGWGGAFAVFGTLPLAILLAVGFETTVLLPVFWLLELVTDRSGALAATVLALWVALGTGVALTARRLLRYAEPDVLDRFGLPKSLGIRDVRQLYRALAAIGAFFVGVRYL